MPEAVLLGDLDLVRVTSLRIWERRKLARHLIPGWDGDLVQDLGAEAAVIHLAGVSVGEGASGILESLRDLSSRGEPVDFVASAAVASHIEQVLVSQLVVHQLGGEVDTYHYELELVRHVEPPPPIADAYDPGFLDAVQLDADALAALDIAATVDGLGGIGEALAKIEEAASFVDDVIATIEEGTKLLTGALSLKEVLAAMGKVVGASGT